MQRVRDPFFSMHIAKWWFSKTCKYYFTICAIFSVLFIYKQYGVGQSYFDMSATFGKLASILFLSFIVFSLFLSTTTILVFIQYYRGILVSLEDNFVIWPASRDANTISDILLFKKYWKHLFRQRVDLSGVIDIRNNTVGPDVDGRFKLDITWDDGGQSHKIEFSNKQRRDQCRAMLLNAKRQAGSKIMSDPNSSF